MCIRDRIDSISSSTSPLRFRIHSYSARTCFLRCLDWIHACILLPLVRYLSCCKRLPPDSYYVLVSFRFWTGAGCAGSFQPINPICSVKQHFTDRLTCARPGRRGGTNDVLVGYRLSRYCLYNTQTQFAKYYCHPWDTHCRPFLKATRAEASALCMKKRDSTRQQYSCTVSKYCSFFGRAPVSLSRSRPLGLHARARSSRQQIPYVLYPPAQTAWCELQHFCCQS